ncbi:MAG: hypothetical protein ACE5KJ_06875, partial [Candidatus Zixiibacteriota bacterium]
ESFADKAILEIPRVGKLFWHIPEARQLFQNYAEALQSGQIGKTEVLRKKVEIFFDDYLKKYPQAYDREKWKFVESLIIDRQPESFEFLARYSYPFVEKHLEKIRRDYLGTIPDSIGRNYGVKITDFKLKLMDDLMVRYPMLRK